MSLEKNSRKNLRRNFKKILVLSILSIMIVSFYILVYFTQMPFSVGLALSGLAVGGIFTSFVNIKPFKELHTPEDFYKESERIIKESKEVRITSTTPGIILASEYNPVMFPFPVSSKPRKSGYRKEYFDSLLKASQVGGVKVRYFFDKENVVSILKQYSEQNCKTYIEKGKEILERFLKETNSNFKIRCGKIPIGSEFRKVTIICNEYIVKSERDKDTQKIRHGTVEKNKDEAFRLCKEFDQQLWVNGEEVTDVSFINRLLKEY
jgi:hypothetical protein